jgi:NAD(P)-dependent dehydrogenase (short-subunit alcohol dehydrogenase family)
MELRLDGKVALITGASKGIGKAIAAAYAASGAAVMISSRKADALEAAAKDMSGDVAWFAANAGDPEATGACVAATMDRFGAIDIVVNNAATNPYMGPTLGISESQADKTVQVNLRGVVTVTRQCWEASLKERGGVVINISSAGGLQVDRGAIGYYNATKAALLHLTRQLAAELAPGVRVNAIAPGLVKTDFARALWEPAEQAVAQHMPLQRLGEPEDIAGAAVFLASDAASWITGATLVVDGGLLLGTS